MDSFGWTTKFAGGVMIGLLCGAGLGVVWVLSSTPPAPAPAPANPFTLGQGGSTTAQIRQTKLHDQPIWQRCLDACDEVR